MQNFDKKYIQNSLSYYEIKVFELWPHPRGQGVG